MLIRDSIIPPWTLEETGFISKTMARYGVLIAFLIGTSFCLEALGCGCNVAFSAYMSQSKANQLSQSMTNGATLIYDKTVSNQHGYYNTRTGIFTAPSNGMYAFTWTLCVDSRTTDNGPLNRGEYGTELMYGTAVIGRLHADTETLYDDDCSTGFVVKYVLANREIRIRNDYAHQGKLLSTEGHTRTTFSGWKLFD